MNSHLASLEKFRPLRLVFAVLVFLNCSLSSVRAASDVDVTIITAEKVVIEKDLITITASARTRCHSSSNDKEGTIWTGKISSPVAIMSEKATFTIRRPLQAQEALAAGWQMSLDAAKELQAGREVGRIGYHGPKITMKLNLIDSIDGYGFLYSKGK